MSLQQATLRPVSARLKAAAAAALVLLGVALPLPASAAVGSKTTYLRQVQPSFKSKTWIDDNGSTGSTKVTLTACKGNKGGERPNAAYLKSVKLSLYKQADWTKSPTLVKSITKYPCGVFDFGTHGRGSTLYFFKIAAVNGVTSSSSTAGKGTFLNADVLINW